MFYHSLVSDWNHGNAHFLRGVVAELLDRGHSVEVYEPGDGWSLANLRADQGEAPLLAFESAYPGLRSHFYSLENLDLDAVLEDADLVLVHEWNDHGLVREIGERRSRSDHFRLLFHDTHHRAVTSCEEMAAYDLKHYDGVLAFGQVISDLYVKEGWSQRAWTWHEAADARRFFPHDAPESLDGDLVWIGNWGDEERTAELHEFLIEPAQTLGLRSDVFGVRYPESGRDALSKAGIRYRGWLPNFLVPATFARYRMTVHVPRRPYREMLPGIPTIRVFEALACGIPLVSAPWCDSENLFHPGTDYLVARDGQEMTEHLRMLRHDRDAAKALADHGRQTILSRHTCCHRVDELLTVASDLGITTAPAVQRPPTVNDSTNASQTTPLDALPRTALLKG